MSRIQPRVVAVAVLVGAALIGGSGDWFVLAALLFGIVNALFAPPGTGWVRGAAVGASLVALGSWPDFRPTVAVLTWLVWPPAMLVAWALATEAPATADEGRSQ